MSPSWISRPNDDLPDKSPRVLTMQRPESRGSFIRRHPWLMGFTLLFVLVGLGVGLGVGLTIGKDSDSDSDSALPTPTSNPTSISGGSPTASIPTSTPTAIWKPTAGSTWQIVLLNALALPPAVNVSIYDIDLFTNPASTIAELHSQGRRVICYFSAGSYEPNRPDSADFTAADKGAELDGWPGEYWLDTTSPNVRRIMSARLALAASKGCDGVDPDNIDAYDNANGFPSTLLTRESAIEYMAFLAGSAHALNLAIGLKNGGAVVGDVIGEVEWEVNEQCVQYGECASFRPFIDAGKPVFHIEYPGGAPAVSAATKAGVCGDGDARGFSTLLKELDLGEWVDAC